jgi:hypothetical protein
MTGDPVPDADLQEQREPESDSRPPHVPRPDEPEADVLEQELPADADDEEDGEDDRRHVGEHVDWREHYPE